MTNLKAHTENQINNVMRSKMGKYTSKPIKRALKTWSLERKLAWCIKFKYI